MGGSCLELRVEGVGHYTHLQVTAGVAKTMALVPSQPEGGDFTLPLTLRVTPPPGVDSQDIALVSVELTDDSQQLTGFARLEDVKWPTGTVIAGTAPFFSFIRTDTKTLANPQSAAVADVNGNDGCPYIGWYITTGRSSHPGSRERSADDYELCGPSVP